MVHRQNLRPSGAVSVQQTMIALQRYNPDAFIDGNINLLRRGQVLRAPTEAQAMEVSSREAIEMVAEQNRLWRERLGPQG
ncbi:MAG: FimV/HubP family polar landmark protein [Gammaproteobacteria bacterium]